jgi:hypothetical protein
VNDLYDNVFTTVAFQSALVATFFGEVERINRRRVSEGKEALAIEPLFQDFLAAVNSFFVPKRASDFRRLVAVFLGILDGPIKEWKLTPSSATFRQVVYRGEMQPDQWPKYRYLFLEIWRGEGSEMSESVKVEREKCRLQIFNSLEEDQRKEYMQRNLKREDTLTVDDRKEIFETSYEAFKTFLRNVGWQVSEIPTKAAIRSLSTIKSEDAADTPAVEEVWEASEVVPDVQVEPGGSLRD